MGLGEEPRLSQSWWLFLASSVWTNKGGGIIRPVDPALQVIKCLFFCFITTYFIFYFETNTILTQSKAIFAYNIHNIVFSKQIFAKNV